MTLDTHWHKRVPDYMAEEYIAKGWVVHTREATTVVLVWPHDGAPT